jgi:hypothetical protein
MAPVIARVLIVPRAAEHSLEVEQIFDELAASVAAEQPSQDPALGGPRGVPRRRVPGRGLRGTAKSAHIAREN